MQKVHRFTTSSSGTVERRSVSAFGVFGILIFAGGVSVAR